MKSENRKPAIVLVHGAFADGSGWRNVIPLLERDGFEVTAVQNHLVSLTDDVATTRRAIDAQRRPTVVVGHSYGGAVITNAASGAANVKALVYVAAFAPDAGEPVGQLLARFGPSAIVGAFTPDAAGFVSLDRTKFRAVFAADVAEAETRIMAATQKPIAGACFEQPTGTPAWKSIPSWYLLAREDQAIKPELQKFMSQRMGARTTEVASSHVPFISHPDVVAELIQQAATAAGN
jgi:pimeloyl-ACP methyl ester carboxylesterase